MTRANIGANWRPVRLASVRRRVLPRPPPLTAKLQLPRSAVTVPHVTRVASEFILSKADALPFAMCIVRMETVAKCSPLSRNGHFVTLTACAE